MTEENKIRIILGVPNGSSIIKPTKTITIELKNDPFIAPEMAKSEKEINEANIEGFKELLIEMIEEKNSDLQFDWVNVARIDYPDDDKNADKELFKRSTKEAPKIRIL